MIGAVLSSSSSDAMPCSYVKRKALSSAADGVNQHNSHVYREGRRLTQLGQSVLLAKLASPPALLLAPASTAILVIIRNVEIAHRSIASPASEFALGELGGKVLTILVVLSFDFAGRRRDCAVSICPASSKLRPTATWPSQSPCP